MQKILREILK